MSEKNEVKKKSRGRKSEYREEYAEQALKLCLLGATDKEIAEFFSVSEQTLNSWKKKFPQFLESLKKGKEVIDRKVEKCLLKRALGYTYEEVRDKYEGDILKERTVTTREIPGDVAAQIFWLKNRKPDIWKDRPENVQKHDTGLFTSIVEAVGGTFRTS